MMLLDLDFLSSLLGPAIWGAGLVGVCTAVAFVLEVLDLP